VLGHPVPAQMAFTAHGSVVNNAPNHKHKRTHVVQRTHGNHQGAQEGVSAPHPRVFTEYDCFQAPPAVRVVTVGHHDSQHCACHMQGNIMRPCTCKMCPQNAGGALFHTSTTASVLRINRGIFGERLFCMVPLNNSFSIVNYSSLNCNPLTITL
jgi:hypothetical protein